MLKTTILGLGAAVALSLVAAVTPALANYAGCTENPSAKGCPGYITPASEMQAKPLPRHAAQVPGHERSAPQKG